MSPERLEEGLHRATRQGKAEKIPAKVPRVTIPGDRKDVEITIGDRTVALSNLSKVFFPEKGYTKRDLLQYYADIAPVLLPHLRDRAMVMKRYPNGIHEKFFFMKRAPAPRPEWIQTCTIEHSSGNVIDFPMIQDLPALLWVINLGCIDLNQWYARCDDVDRPDYLHFDLDPGPRAGFDQVLETARIVHEALTLLKMPHYAKTTGSRGIHIYAPIVRGPTQKQVWTFAKAVAHTLASQYPKLVTAVYALAKRPDDKVLVDYNQNAWGRTLASIYSVRPVPVAAVSTPVSWEEIDQGIRLEDFRMDNVTARVKQLGDLWKPLLQEKGRFRLDKVL
ncbi:MAG TPA: non-homologous end-joining DNA ligase [Gemmatimonadales bacterium]|nr:non-homologous end-joining DNA ligase [Gemmatimonadales bacterium]